MMHGIRWLALAAFLLGAMGSSASAATSTCGDISEPQSFDGNPEFPYHASVPVIFGKRYQAPPMRVRFVDGATKLPLKVQRVTVSYAWQWLEYPYPEHAWGAWSFAEDSLDCHPNQDGWIETLPHDVLPRGWYDGVHTLLPWPRHPVFDSVEMVALTAYSARVTLRTGDLQKFGGGDLVVTVFDGWRTEIQWQPKHKS
jgi:hypothetical protein